MNLHKNIRGVVQFSTANNLLIQTLIEPFTLGLTTYFLLKKRNYIATLLIFAKKSCAKRLENLYNTDKGNLQ